ncbi:MAG: chemotaxis protein CheX [Planctomycetota bacterium]|jgi:chemotaxis protein CheX
MDVSFINHFIESATNVFDTMLGVQIRRKSLSLKDSPAPTHEVSAIIGLSGKVVGSVVVSFATDAALKSAGEMLLTEFDEVNAEVVDAVGELTNMIAGGAKAAMDHMELSLGLPNVVCGMDHKIFFPGNVKPISVGFDTPWGELAIDVGFNEVLEGSLADVDAQQEAVGV